MRTKQAIDLRPKLGITSAGFAQIGGALFRRAINRAMEQLFHFRPLSECHDRVPVSIGTRILLVQTIVPICT